VLNYHPRTSEDDKSSTSATDVDEDAMSETDVDQSSGEEVIDDDETEGVVSDSDNEVIIVSEVKGKTSGDVSLNTTEVKSRSDGGDASKADAGSSDAVNKTHVQVISDVSSSRWMQRVKMLESTMSEMKAKFAEVLRVKVSDVCIYSTVELEQSTKKAAPD